MAPLKQSTARNRMVFMVDETDHVSGLPGLTLTITASKAGAAFGSISPTVTDRGSGWYDLALTTSHTDTLGDIALHITSTGADPTDLVDEVVVELPGMLGTQAKADVNAEVLDVLNVDAFTEPSSVPAATSSLRAKIGWIFVLARNKVIQTGTTQTARDDSDSVDVGTTPVSDSAGVFTRGRWT